MSSLCKSNFDRIHNAILYYKDKNENLNIPYQYVIPNDTETISLKINNLKLGNIVSRIRNRGDFRNYHPTLEKLGLKIRSSPSNHTKVINALKIYHEKYNTLDIKTKYVIPLDDESWPVEFRGMYLGSQVDHLRRKKRQLDLFYNTSEDKKRHKNFSGLSELDIKALDEIGFIWNRRQRLNNIDLLNILLLYKSIHGNINIATSYVIPNEDPWPKSLHGWKLGSRISHIRNRGDFHDIREDLDGLDFPYDVWRDKIFQDILEKLADYKRNSLESRFKEPTV